MKNEGYSIKIQADGEVLFKLLSLKHAEELLNEHFPLPDYCTQNEVRELVVAVSALPQFSLSVKPEKTQYKASSATLTFQVNLDLETLKQMSVDEIQEDFFLMLIDLLETTSIQGFQSDKLRKNIMQFFK